MQVQHRLMVWGELACFTNPLMKAERFSYPCPTPSACRGILDAIYAKPVEFRWQVTKVEILSPLKYIALRRNEVKEKASVRAVQQWMAGTSEPEPLVADATDEAKGRTQRQTMALKDVRYRITAEIRPWEGMEANINALNSQFVRRAEHGKCVYQPAFGCREFPAYFRLESADGAVREAPCEFSMDVGWMLYDVFDLSRPGTSASRPAISLFRAAIKSGVLEVPPFESDAVRKTPLASPEVE